MGVAKSTVQIPTAHDDPITSIPLVLEACLVAALVCCSAVQPELCHVVMAFEVVTHTAASILGASSARLTHADEGGKEGA